MTVAGMPGEVDRYGDADREEAGSEDYAHYDRR
jgi:hypothetical protein